MAGRGRPKKEHPREIVVSFKLSQRDYQTLINRSTLAGKPAGTFAREIVEKALAEQKRPG